MGGGISLILRPTEAAASPGLRMGDFPFLPSGHDGAQLRGVCVGGNPAFSALEKPSFHADSAWLRIFCSQLSSFPPTHSPDTAQKAEDPLILSPRGAL